jgi:hypothetical protein
VDRSAIGAPDDRSVHAPHEEVDRYLIWRSLPRETGRQPVGGAEDRRPFAEEEHA